jgi:hypothetical protein
MKRDGFTYANLEDVKSALDVLETSRSEPQIIRNLRSASDNVEGMLKRRFYPEIETRFFDWPTRQYNRPWRLWLSGNEIISVSELVAGGVIIDSADFFLRNDDGDSKPPFDQIEIDLDSNAIFQSGNTHQRAISVTGLYGYDDESEPVGTLSGNINDTVTTIDVSDGSLISVGDLVRVDSERLVTTARSFVDSNVNVGGLPGGWAVTQDFVAVSNGSLLNIGEVIRVDSERLLITGISGVSGNNLSVKRGWDGTAISNHTAPTDIFVSRRFTVKRAALGTTADSHTDATALDKYSVPPLIRDLTIGEAMVTLLQQRTGMARTIGSADAEKETRGIGLEDLRKQAKHAYGRSGYRVLAV